MRRVSGPLLDRIELRVVMPRVDAETLVGAASPEPSIVVTERIRHAWGMALSRNGGHPNGSLQGRRLLSACAMDRAARATLTEVARGLDLTARGVHRIMRVARTVADLHGRTSVESDEGSWRPPPSGTAPWRLS